VDCAGYLTTTRWRSTTDGSRPAPRAARSWGRPWPCPDTGLPGGVRDL